MARGDLVRSFDGMVSDKTLESLQEFEDIQSGLKPDRREETGDIGVMTRFDPRDAGRRVEVAGMEPRVEDVPKVEWAKARGSIDSFVCYHYDLAQLFVGRRHPFFAAFRAALFNPPMPPLLRVMFPGPIFRGGRDPEIFSSMLVMEKGDMADRFRRYIVQETFTRRLTSAERESRKAAGKPGGDEYWELLCHRRRMNIDGAKFVLNLYLPAGMEYTVMPRVDGGTGLIEACYAPAMEAVTGAGSKTLLKGSDLV